MADTNTGQAVIDKDSLPEAFPTHHLSAAFWEQLGRVVGTFGALEEVLGKAIFALTGTRLVEESEVEQALKVWQNTLEHALKDTLSPLIDLFGRAVREHSNPAIENLEELLDALRAASKIRNVLRHGSWQSPDQLGRSKSFFVDKQLHVFDTAVDVHFLHQTQRHVAELLCEVMSVQHIVLGSDQKNLQ